MICLHLGKSTHKPYKACFTCRVEPFSPCKTSFSLGHLTSPYQLEPKWLLSARDALHSSTCCDIFVHVLSCWFDIRFIVARRYQDVSAFSNALRIVMWSRTVCDDTASASISTSVTAVPQIDEPFQNQKLNSLCAIHTKQVLERLSPNYYTMI